MSRENAAKEARKMMTRAIRRLSVIEYVLVGVNVVLALLGGGIAAVGLQAAVGFPFRVSWAVCSLLLFIVPGLVVLGRERKVHGANQVERTNSSDGIEVDG